MNGADARQARKRSTPQSLAALAGHVSMIGLNGTCQTLRLIQAPLTEAVWLLEAWIARLATEIERRRAAR